MKHTPGGEKNCQRSAHKWKPLDPGAYKLNADASFTAGKDSFSIRMVLRDHVGAFIAGKVMSLKKVDSVVEAEAVAVKEAHHENQLEVGYTLDVCRDILESKPDLFLSFAKRQANKAAHLLARVPCLLGCQSIFTSRVPILLETLMFDAKF